jgi:general stress protein 26
MTLRFATDKHSRKVAQINNNPEVHLTAGVTDPADAHAYVQIQGRAQFVTDQAERDAFWHDGLKQYFSGPDDPNYGIVITKPYRIEYFAMGNYEPEVWEQ